MKLEAKTRLLAKTGRPLSSMSSGTYVCALPDAETQTKLARVSAALGHPLSQEKIEDLHSTIIYAKGNFPNGLELQRGQRFGAKVTGLEFWDGHDNDGYVVLLLDSPDLMARHQFWVSRGLTHSFEDYTPHVTLFDKIEKTADLVAKINSVAKKAIGTTLVFDQEQVEGLKSK
jgi:hypothetical protein